MEAAAAETLRSERLRQRLRLQKKLREVEKLEAQAKEAPLQANQRAKVVKKQELQESLAALGPAATQIVVITPAGSMLANMQMENSSTAADLLKVLVAKGLATTLYRHRLVRKDRVLELDQVLQLPDAGEEETLELTLVRVASSYLATATNDGNVSLWELGVGRMSLEGHDGRVNCIKFSPDCSMLLTASGAWHGPAPDNTAKLWSVESGQCLHTLAGFQVDRGFHTAEFSPDGSHVVLSQGFGDMHGERPGVTVWRTRDGKRLRPLCIDGCMVGHGATWSPAGDLIATCSGESHAWVFCAKTGSPLHCLDHAWGDCFEASFSPDGRFVCTIVCGVFFVRRAADMWASNLTDVGVDPKKSAPVVFRAQVHESEQGVNQGFHQCVALSSQGLGAFAVADEINNMRVPANPMVAIVDLNHDPGTVLRKFSVGSEVVFLQFEPHGSALLLLTTAGEPPSLWSVADGTRLRTFGEHESNRVVWSPDGAFIAAFYNDGKIRIWCTADGACLHSFEEAGVTCASFW